ncbi:MAG: hypothetical protein HY655_09575 [Acidobacteria bacterium]|nr:hypothetical protein [Acidobacteriota bacterium]
MTAQDAGSLRSELFQLAAGMTTLQRRMEQLAALHERGEEVGRIARLERVLEFDRVVAHVRAAVARAELAGDPVPHLLVSDLLPAEVYAAVLDAIPAAVFFNGRVAQGQELRVPPRLAPMVSIITWMFVDEVGRLLSDLLVARLAEPLAAYARARFPSLPPFGDWGVDITVTESRLVRRGPGYVGPPPADGRWDLINGVVHLARHQDTAEYGGRLQTQEIAFRANSMVTWVGPPEAHVHVSIPRHAPPNLERYTYEFRVGPTREGRSRLGN